MFTTSALRDISQTKEWLTQSGSGKRSNALAKRLLRAANGLSTTAGTHPQDRFFEGCHQLVVERYVIRYIIVDTDTGGQVSVERIYGPGQDRNS